MKLSTKISIVFSLTIIILVYIIGTEACLYSYSSTISLVEKNSRSSAKTTARDIEALLQNYKNIAKASGSDITLIGNVPNEVRVKKVEQLAKQYGFTSGNLLNKKGVSIKDGTDFSDRDYVKAALNGKTNISDVTLSKYTNTYGISIAAPLISSGRIIGVVYYRADVDFMNDIVKHISVGQGSYAYILDENNNVIAHKNEKYIMNDKYKEMIPKDIKNCISSQNGSMTCSYGGDKYICGYSKIDKTANCRVVIASPESAYNSDILRFVKKLVISDIIALIVAIIVALIIARVISRPIVRVKNLLSALAQGDLSVQLNDTKNKDELGILQNSAVSLNRMLSDMLTQSGDVLSKMAAYDLTSEDMREYPGKFNELAASINSIKAILSNMILNIQNSSVNVDGGSKQLAEAASMLSEGTMAQASSLQKLVTDVENVAQNINANSDKTIFVNESLGNLDSEIKDGDQKMQELSNVVRTVEEMSEDIKKIVNTIDGIAFQTNILALNASVEAARAGESGKGFAVVAQEIGTLATKSSDASKKTAELIEKCIKGIESAKEYADITSDSLAKIVSDSNNIANAFDEMSKANEIQAKNANDIRNEIENISQVVQSNTATAQQTAASTEVLSEQAAALKDMTGRFKVDY
ncbi:methyl-accepting chemotaxis protein [Clostridium sp. AF34-13]|uniref:methyl-accepting chemotaxis protein n=1 Tax=Clostridium sp. AF34-13 TaxID=2293012 RepID=UPI000E4A3A76|nr:methyl-accepting chemotaxis protein [Clostridium sp. AF34-13]RHP26124.1 methyl-accepting chemotaxis protein [Clostridium sp. AF34-13]